MSVLAIALHITSGNLERVEDVPTSSFRGLSLTKVYDEIVSVLMYSPVDANAALSRDGGPQLFELLLEERDKSLKDELALADLIPLDYQTSFERPTLRPYIFNIQRYMLEKTSSYMQDIIIHYDATKGQGEDKGEPLTYERKTSRFEEVVKRNEVLSNEKVGLSGLSVPVRRYECTSVHLSILSDGARGEFIEQVTERVIFELYVI